MSITPAAVIAIAAWKHHRGRGDRARRDVAGAVTFAERSSFSVAGSLGPARPFVAMRRAMAPFLRDNAVTTYGVTDAVTTAEQLRELSDLRNKRAH